MRARADLITNKRGLLKRVLFNCFGRWYCLADDLFAWSRNWRGSSRSSCRWRCGHEGWQQFWCHSAGLLVSIEVLTDGSGSKLAGGLGNIIAVVVFVGNIYCGCSLSFSLSFVIVRCAWQLSTSTQTRCTGTGAAGTKCCWQPPPTKWMPFTKARSGKVFRPYVVSFWFWLHKFNIFNFLPNNSQIQWRTKHCKCVPF